MSERYKYPPDGIPRNSEVNDATFSHIGVHCHEFAHTLGLSDHYGDFFYNKWGLMSDGGNKGSVRGNNPAPINPMLRWKLGWITLQDVTTKKLSEALIYNSQMNDVYRFQVFHYSGPQCFLVENRQTGTAWNRFLPAGGVLVWHSTYWYPYTNDDELIDLIEADGSNVGEADDGDAFPGSGDVRRLTDFSSPSNSKLFFDGSNSNVVIQNISNSGSTMTADLSPYWYGSIVGSQSWNGTVLVGEGLSVS